MNALRHGSVIAQLENDQLLETQGDEVERAYRRGHNAAVRQTVADLRAGKEPDLGFLGERFGTDEQRAYCRGFNAGIRHVKHVLQLDAADDDALRFIRRVFDFRNHVTFADIERARGLVEAVVAERDRLLVQLNTPHTAEFLDAVRVEAAHQRERWGADHDAGKRPEDWVALLAYLLGKATKAHFDGDAAKLLHHVITIAAACANWHANATGTDTRMRPGVDR